MISNYNNSCSVCITCCDRDVHLLNDAFNIISLQTIGFHELIISANGLDKNFFDNHPKHILVAGKKIPISYHVYPKRKNPGFARNYGAKFCETEYIMFCDVDDVSFSFRLEVALDCIKIHKPDCFIHSQLWYCKPLESVEGEYALKEVSAKQNYKRVSQILDAAFVNTEAFMADQVKPPSVFEKVSNVTRMNYSNKSMGDVFVPSKGKVVVAYGHPIVKVDTLMEIKYDETLKLGEDTSFLYDLFKKNKTIMYSSGVLLIHRGINHSTANYEILTLQGKWEVCDNFRKEYLQNRLDKNLNVYHSADYDQEYQEKPINPK